MNKKEDSVRWDKLSKGELFAIAKWHEAQSEAYRNIIMILINGNDIDKVKDDILFPGNPGNPITD